MSGAEAAACLASKVNARFSTSLSLHTSVDKILSGGEHAQRLIIHKSPQPSRSEIS